VAEIVKANIEEVRRAFGAKADKRLPDEANKKKDKA
jgi:hypothetical protein